MMLADQTKSLLDTPQGRCNASQGHLTLWRQQNHTGLLPDHPSVHLDQRRTPSSRSQRHWLSWVPTDDVISAVRCPFSVTFLCSSLPHTLCLQLNSAAAAQLYPGPEPLHLPQYPRFCSHPSLEVLELS